MKTFSLLITSASAAGDWTWVDIAGTMCMNGKETGAWVRKDSGKNLGIYLYPGGACFNAVTCATAASSNKPGNPGSSGIFDNRADNPLAGYNWIAVPYCTGDVFAGDVTKAFQGATRHFNGVNNVKLTMEYATQNFKDVETLFVTGESAGGFGSAASYVTIRDFYPDARGVLMDDSGPIIDDDALAVCLQEEWRQIWDMNKNLPADCPCNNDKGNLVSAWTYGKQKFPNDSFSLISSQNDVVISTFFAYGNKDCHAVLPVGYGKLAAALERLSQVISVYTIPGSAHTHTSHGEFYSRVVSNQALYQWIGQLLDPAQPDPDSVAPTEEDIFREIYGNSTASVLV